MKKDFQQYKSNYYIKKKLLYFLKIKPSCKTIICSRSFGGKPGDFPQDEESKQGNVIHQTEWPIFTQLFKVPRCLTIYITNKYISFASMTVHTGGISRPSEAFPKFNDSLLWFLRLPHSQHSSFSLCKSRGLQVTLSGF